MGSMQMLQDITGRQKAAIPMLAPGEGQPATMVALGPVKLHGVGDAQAGIVAMAKDLAAQGVIEINEGKNDEMVQ